jgi:hypothetical protein
MLQFLLQKKMLASVKYRDVSVSKQNIIYVLHSSKYTPYRTFLLKVTGLNRTYVLRHVPLYFTMSCFADNQYTSIKIHIKYSHN